jgi:hypothetical protein
VGTPSAAQPLCCLLIVALETDVFDQAGAEVNAAMRSPATAVNHPAINTMKSKTPPAFSDGVLKQQPQCKYLFIMWGQSGPSHSVAILTR